MRKRSSALREISEGSFEMFLVLRAENEGPAIGSDTSNQPPPATSQDKILALQSL